MQILVLIGAVQWGLPPIGEILPFTTDLACVWLSTACMTRPHWLSCFNHSLEIAPGLTRAQSQCTHLPDADQLSSSIFAFFNHFYFYFSLQSTSIFIVNKTSLNHKSSSSSHSFAFRAVLSNGPLGRAQGPQASGGAQTAHALFFIS